LRLHHLALRTPDVDALCAFYQHVFGLVEVRCQPHSVWLQMGDAMLMIEQADAGEPGIPAGSLEFFALAVDPEAGAAVEARLTALGVPIEGRTASTRYFRDPDGRRVGVSSYVF
jgi:catechol 2,3-dioxygenase-like lactoylglutathione lyase family enzyme